MAATNGFKTSVRIGAVRITLMDGWTLNIQRGVSQYSSFGTTFKGAFPNIKSWTATCKGTLDRTATGQTTLLDQLESSGAVADIALRFYPSTATGTYWSGNGVLDGSNIDSAVEDKANVSFSFTGNGAISWTAT